MVAALDTRAAHELVVTTERRTPVGEAQVAPAPLRVVVLVPYRGIRGPIPKHTPLLVGGLRSLGCDTRTEEWGRRRDGETFAEKLLGRVRDIARIRCALRRDPADVFVLKTAHDWNTLCRDIPLLLAIRRLVPAVVVQFHGSQSNLLLERGHRPFKSASAVLLRLSDAALVLSSEEQREWQSFKPELECYVVSNPFLPSAGASGVRCGEDGSSAESPAILFVGRLIRAKGVLDVLEAVGRIDGQSRPVRLHLVGDGPLGDRLRARARELGLTDRVTFSGYLEGEALERAYSAATVLVLPSWTEGFPVAVTEAMSFGLPVVTTRLRGMADHLREGVNTLFVPVGDPEALAAALIRLLADRDLRRRMCEANRQKVKEFEPQRVARRYHDVLHQVVGDAPARSGGRSGR